MGIEEKPTEENWKLGVITPKLKFSSDVILGKGCNWVLNLFYLFTISVKIGN